MRLLGFAVCSLGLWVLISAFVSAQWVGIVFGALAAVFGLAAAGTSK